MKKKIKNLFRYIKRWFCTRWVKLWLCQCIGIFGLLLILSADDLYVFQALAILQSSCFMIYICFTCKRSDYVLSDFKKEIELKAQEDDKYVEVQELLNSVEKEVL